MSRPSTVTGAWVRHDDPAGISARVPAGWRVQAGSPGEIVVSEPRGAAAALLRVRNVPAREDLARWLKQDYAGTEPGLHNVRMLAVEVRGAQHARAVFDYGSNVFQGRASVVTARRGDRVTLFVAAAARAEFAQRLPALARILGSLRFAAADRDGGIDAPTVPGLKRLLLEIGVGVRVRVPHSHSMISDARNPHECLLCRVGASYSSIVNYH